MARRTWIVYVVLMQVHLSLLQVEVMGLWTCAQNEYMDLTSTPLACRNCTVCSVEQPYQLTNCTATNDTVCSRCEPDLIWSEDLARCVRCGPCCSNSTVDSACSGDPATGCLYDPACNVTTFTPVESVNEDDAVLKSVMYAVIAAGLTIVVAVTLCLRFVWQKVRKKRKAKEGRNTLDPVFLVKDNYAFDEEQIYEDTLNYNFNSGESGQNVVDKSPSTLVFRESRPQNDYVQHSTFLGKTPITEYDELGLPTRFLNLPEEKFGEDVIYDVPVTDEKTPNQTINAFPPNTPDDDDSCFFDNDSDDGNSVHTYCSIRDVPIENPCVEDVTLVKGPDDPPKPSTSTNRYKTTIQVHTDGHQQDQEATDDRTGYVEFYQNVKGKIYRSVIMLLGYVNAGKSSLVDSLLGPSFRFNRSSQNVHCSNIQAKGSDWTPVENPMCEILNQELQGKMADVILPQVNDGDSTTAGAGAYQTECINETHGLHEFSTVMKIVDISGEFGSYKTHQLLLSPSMIFLLVMDVTKKMDEVLSPKTPEEEFDCPKTPREFLSYWLNTVGTFVGNCCDSKPGKTCESVIIVLTNTDKLDAHKKHIQIENYKKEISRHIKGHQTCKHVEKRIIALSNEEEDENEVKVLRELIYKLSDSKATFGVMAPCSWLKCEADLLDFCKKMENRWLHLGELHEHIAKPIGMSLKQLKEFLRFHGQLGNLIFAETESMDSMIITDTHLLVEAFQAIMRAWHCTDTSEWTFDAETQLEDEISRGILSGTSLQRIWEQLGAVPAEQLASIMMHRHQLIPCGQHNEVQTFESKKFIIPTLLPPCDKSKHADKQPEVSALLYLFHYAPEVEENFTSVFLPTTVFPMLVGVLTDKKPTEKAWKLENVYSDQATFKAGKSREPLVKLSTCGPAIVLKSIRVVPETQRGSQCAYSRVRSRIDNSIRTILQTHHPKLHCSVCVTPCDLEMIIGKGKYTCVEVLGTIHSIGEESLSHAYCNEHDQTTKIKHFSCWFCDTFDSGESDLDKDKDFRTVIRKVISKIPDLGKLMDVAEALDLEQSEVLQANSDSHHQIRETSRLVLYSWFNGTKRSHHELLHQLKDALHRAGVSVAF